MDDTNLLQRSLDDATRIIDSIRSEQLTATTPCPDFTVEQLVAHLAEGHEMFITALGGEESSDHSWSSVATRLLAAAKSPGAPDDVIELPYGPFPRSVVIGQALAETAIHTADLAHATGQSIGDDDIYERVFDVVTDDWRAPQVLEPAQPCADDAPLAERVLAFAGRKI